MIEEAYTWIYENNEYSLVIKRPIPATGDSTTLPPLEQLPNLNAGWMLYVRTYEVEVNPETIGQAVARLGTVHELLKGAFPFKVYDRLVHDTRNIDRPQPS
jgi:hypothetical protein